MLAKQKDITDHQELETIRRRRRELHQIPEQALDLPKTAAYLKNELKNTSAEIIELDQAGSSFLAYFDAGKPETIAFRADMDALPVFEETGVEFKSLHEGKMHACGHDGHMSMLLGLADRIERRKDELKSNILLIFQAGEETPGGARLICDQNVFEKYNVQSVFGSHLWPMIEAGSIGVRPIEMMARSCEIRVYIHGKSAHAARYQEGIDTLEAGCRFILESIALEKGIDEKQFRILRFGKMEAGTVMNAVAAECYMEGTLRTFLDPVFDELQSGLIQIKDKLEEQMGVRIDIDFSSGYPAVINDEILTEEILERNPAIIRLEKPEMISEDFSFYQKKVPGVFFFVGTGTGIPLHSSHFNFDEEILKSGIDLYEDLAFHPLKHALNKNRG